jgi:hypothetical protein
VRAPRTVGGQGRCCRLWLPPSQVSMRRPGCIGQRCILSDAVAFRRMQLHFAARRRARTGRGKGAQPVSRGDFLICVNGQSRLHFPIQDNASRTASTVAPTGSGVVCTRSMSGKHVPDIQTARRLADVLAVPAPYLYAEDDTLAAWILAYTQASPTMRKKITRTVTGD